MLMAVMYKAGLVDYSKSHDFEDLASFTYEGQQYILIADTGDNLLATQRLFADYTRA